LDERVPPDSTLCRENEDSMAWPTRPPRHNPLRVVTASESEKIAGERDDEADERERTADERERVADG